MSELIWDFKSSDESGGIIEQKIWAVSKTGKNPFGYKFSLCYIKDGKRILCYDNGENKHPHSITEIRNILTTLRICGRC